MENEEFEAKWERCLVKMGYCKIATEMAIEVTEFAEILYNFKGAMTVENIKANLVSFLLANHYRKIDLEKLTVLTKEQIVNTIGYKSQERYLARHATDQEANAVAEAQLTHTKKQIEEGKV